MSVVKALINTVTPRPWISFTSTLSEARTSSPVKSQIPLTGSSIFFSQNALAIPS